MVPLIHTPRELAGLLASRHAIAADELGRLRRAVDERPLAYPLGAGQADLIAVAAGIKPVLRRTLSRADAAAEVQRYAHLGLVSHVADPPAGLARHGEVFFYLGREPGRNHEAARAEQLQDDEALGRLLGYPRCCVEAFLAVPHPRTTAAVVQANFSGARRVAPAWLNCVDLRVFNYVSWIPCGPWCDRSLRYAEAVRERIASPFALFVTQSRGEAGFGYFALAVDRALAAHRLHVTPGVQLSMMGEFTGGEVTVTHAWATARDRHPAFPADPDEAEATARLLKLVAAGRRVRVDGQAVMVDDAAVVRAPSAFVAAFTAGRGPFTTRISRGTRG
jgi:hypothetical protein